ncbi:hypothetical protein [Streptomyces californicus]|uniref:hypothetical protein n=1 Tax=Streptomyces californicus TaxID=67351 RepID=UPI00372056D3
MGQGATFWIFGGISALTFVFVMKRVPKTETGTIEEISDDLQKQGRTAAAAT